MTDKPGYRRPQAGTQPEYLHPTYQSTNLRSPSKPLVHLPHSLSEITGPTIGAEHVAEKDNDLTAQHDGEPLGAGHSGGDLAGQRRRSLQPCA